MYRLLQRTLVSAALCFSAFLVLPTTADAAKPRVGLGGGLGDPTGPSLKVFFHPQHALQVDMGWAPLHHGHGILHANYLFHFKPFIENSVFDFGMYLGVGAGMTVWTHRRYGYGYKHGGVYGKGNCKKGGCDNCNDNNNDCFYRAAGVGMNVRAPVGVFFHFAEIPIDTVLEGGWSPYVFYPDLFHGDFSAKVRYYF
jgi:hypothetical protein